MTSNKINTLMGFDHNCYYEYKAKSTIKNKTEKAFQDLVSLIKLPLTLKIVWTEEWHIWQSVPGSQFVG